MTEEIVENNLNTWTNFKGITEETVKRVKKMLKHASFKDFSKKFIKKNAE